MEAFVEIAKIIGAPAAICLLMLVYLVKVHMPRQEKIRTTEREADRADARAERLESRAEREKAHVENRATIAGLGEKHEAVVKSLIESHERRCDRIERACRTDKQELIQALKNVRESKRMERPEHHRRATDALEDALDRDDTPHEGTPT